MGVYIKGMTLPPKGMSQTIMITVSGKVKDIYSEEEFDVVEVPEPHGRLVDTTTAYQDTMKYGEHFRKSVLKIINDLPTVIEAEE